MTRSLPVRTTLTHYKLRHDLTLAPSAGRWLRARVRHVARGRVAAPGVFNAERVA